MDEWKFVDLLERFIKAVIDNHRSDHVEDSINKDYIRDELIAYLKGDDDEREELPKV
jgi:hypothetical protein